MRLSRMAKVLLGIWIAGTLVVLCLASAIASGIIANLGSNERNVDRASLLNHIAFVGNDRNLWLVTPDDEELTSITSDGRGYSFPTWSPDSRRLAFIGLDDDGNMALYGFDGANSNPTVLFEKPESAPFYIYWSPDSRSVTFLTQEQSGLAMRVADADQPGANRVMAEGAPFYWVWSPEGDQVLMHVGGSRSASHNAHLSFMENTEGAQRVELKLAPGRFQAPVWSSSGQYVYYIAADDSGAEAIHKTDVATSQQTLVADLSSSTFIVLSPDDRHLAYLQLQRMGQMSALGTAFVIGTDGGKNREVMKDWVAAMYWSPDGKKLALLTSAQAGEGPTARGPGLAAPQFQQDRLRWWIYDVETEALELLTTFVPTIAFLQTVPYFDQYHLSLTFWSPDSRYFVISRRNVTGQGGSIWVLDSTGREAPRQIGEGTLAVWSWQ